MSFQIVNANSQFTLECRQCLQQVQQQYNDYQIIGVIGAQSTGKSTLMNALFNTDFTVLNSKVKRQQTTQGIWLSIQNRHVIFDVEGTDSANRWGSDNFEKHVSLFTLSLSDILLINIWVTDVGRFNSSQYSILESILSMQLKLWGIEYKKTLLFVVRDCSSNENIESLSLTILNDVNKIWSSLRTKNTMKETVDIKIIALANPIYCEQQFKQGIAKLRNLILSIDSNAPKVPIHQFDMLCASIWNTVSKDKDLNLPETKHMIMMIRCDQIIEELIKEVKLPDSLQSNHNLKAQLEQIYRMYLNRTQFYEQSILESKWKECIQKINTAHYQKIQELIQQLQLQCQNQLKDQLTEIMNKCLGSIAKIEIKEIYQLQQQQLLYYNKQIQHLKNLLPEKQMASLQKQFEESIELFISTFKQQIFLSFQQDLLNQTDNELKDSMTRIMIQYSHSCVVQCKQEENEIIEDAINKVVVFSKFLNFKTNNPQIALLEQKITQKGNEIFNQIMCRLPEFSIERFQKVFKKDQKGYPIQWYQLDELVVRKRYDDCLAHVIETLEQISPQLISYNLSQQLVERATKEVKQKAFEELEEALRKRHYDNRNTVYYILYIILAYILYEKVLWLLMSGNTYLLLIILIIIWNKYQSVIAVFVNWRQLFS